MNTQDIIDFWFAELTPSDWWEKSDALDATIQERFGAIHRAASKGELWRWRDEPQGRLAEILVLDQFSRNIYRDTPAAFACDPLSLALAQEAVRAGADAEIEAKAQSFLYMPYMHSESAAVHVEGLRLFEAMENGPVDFELKHKRIVDRFGRYPHRNAILGRESTAEELEFLNGPDSSF